MAKHIKTPTELKTQDIQTRLNKYKKNKPLRSKKVRDWFHNQPCHFCREIRVGFVTGHHEPLNGHGMATKGPDDEQIPMCLICHNRLEKIEGKESYYKNRNIDRKEVVNYYKKLVREELGL